MRGSCRMRAVRAFLGVATIENGEVPTFVIEAVVRVAPLEGVHDQSLAVAGVGGGDFFAFVPAEDIVIAEARVPGRF